MKKLTPLVAAFFLIFLGASFCNGVDTPKYSPEELKAAENYDKNVSADLKKNISQKEYQKRVTTLSSLNYPETDEHLLSLKQVVDLAQSPCYNSLYYLNNQYSTDPAARAALDTINQNFSDLPSGYESQFPKGNPWKGNANSYELLTQMNDVFGKWCTFLPEIQGNEDNGLYYIQYFAFFYYRNVAGQDFVQGRDPNNPGQKLKTGFKFTWDFSNQRGEFMWSHASARHVKQWVTDPRLEITDYERAPNGTYMYTSFNQFFARKIKTSGGTIPSRPVTMPDKDYVIVAPTDCIMNPLVQVLNQDGTNVRQFIDNPLQRDTVLDVKNIPISVEKLLGGAGSELKEKFNGGTGLSCILMPNTYHNFHSPVDGTIVYKEIVKTNTYGYLDFVNFVPLDGNVARPGTDFSQFEVFQRGVIIIEVTYKDYKGEKQTGYVASIPVGLDTIGSVVFADGVKEGARVKKGFTRFGNFYYGGSLNILLFSEGMVSGAVQTRMGNQIAIINTGTAPPVQDPPSN